GSAREVLLRLPPPDPALPAVPDHGALPAAGRPHRVLVPPLPDGPQPPRRLDPRAPRRVLDLSRRRPVSPLPPTLPGAQERSPMPDLDAPGPILPHYPLPAL